jgi:outer membrane protein OmpA-like peptidoglycan-associated protein
MRDAREDPMTKRASLTIAAAAAALAFAPAAFAQSNPSADQIINSLRPTSGLTGTTRGIRPVGNAPAPSAAPAPATSPAAPAATPAPAAPMQASASPAVPAQAPSVNLTVQFASGSAELTPQARQTLDELGKALSSPQLAAYRFRIEGHTDTVGTPAENQALSDHRAAAVVAYLEQKFGVKASRLEPVGMGERGLLVPTPPQTPEPRNRRVTVVNIGG